MGNRSKYKPQLSQRNLRKNVSVAEQQSDYRSIIWLIIIALLYVSPAIWKGGSFGPFDLGLNATGLGSGLYNAVHNWLNGDIIMQMVPWNYLNWQLIHHLQFPLWNKYVLLGLPNFFNFQSATLSLPSLISYLFPPQFAFLVAVVVKIIIAGSGVYFFCRTIGLGTESSLFAGIVFGLSGAFVNEVGWTLADVMAWIGWIFAFAYILYKKPNASTARIYVPLLAISTAFAIYGGFPEADIIVAVTGLIYFGSIICLDLIRKKRAAIVGIAYMLSGLILGLLLSAPLWVPGYQLAQLSSRKLVLTHSGLPIHAMAALLLQGYYGYPLNSSQWFGPVNYYETAAYIGLVALVLAIMAVFDLYKNEVVFVLVLTSSVLVGIIYNFHVFQFIINKMTQLGTVDFARSRLALAFMISVLSAFGCEKLLYTSDRKRTRIAFWWGLFLVTSIVAILYIRFELIDRHLLTPIQMSIRYGSFGWPLVLILLMVIIGLLIHLGSFSSKKRLIYMVLLGSEALFLLSSGIGINSYSHQYFPVNSKQKALVEIVGSNVVGLNKSSDPISVPTIGFIPEMNIAYHVREFAAYDPMIPTIYFSSWENENESQPKYGSWFTPSIDSASVAKEYGIKYVLAPLVPAPQLIPAYAAQLASALRGAGLSGNDYFQALDILFQRYTTRSDLQNAFPLDKPGFIQYLLAWTKQFQNGSAIDGDKSLFLPYRKQLYEIEVVLDKTPTLQSRLQELFYQEGPPEGMQFVVPLGDEALYEVPESSELSFLNGDQTSKVDYTKELNNYTWELGVDVKDTSDLAVRLTNIPGWHATIDGRTAQLKEWKSIMQQIEVPPGQHEIRIWYWPRLFTIGIWLSLLGIVTLVLIVGYQPIYQRWQETRRKAQTM